MKKLTIIKLLLLSLLLIACYTPKGTIVRDAEGNLYRLRPVSRETFKIDTLQMKEVDTIMKKYGK